MRVVAITIPDGVNAFDAVSGGQIFAAARLPDGSPCYDVRFCGEPTDALASGQQCFSLRPKWPFAAVDEADTVIVPAAASIFDPPAPRLADAIERAVGRGARVASICTGAFALGALGLLDGLRATTHWQYCDELARRYPLIEVDPAVLFVDNNTILTSAGASAGMDMCLHMVRCDYGSAVATETARRIVMPPQRAGGQAQFINRHVPPQGATALQPVLTWIEEHLENPLTLADIANHAGLSIRTLQRRFRTQLGTTALQWLLSARIHRAQQLLETTDLPIERIADESGFGSVVTLRHHFTRTVGTAPRNYRRTFGAPSAV
ncbi:GlxA family transcriptional regulator [Nocardia arthritidis]|uniref:Helix-turn-helix domain-containing protein n=1 Tax=Nocardia arthritidis TaxID=228602 RepID=A0A6G9Y8U8_9NOCA|nr:AraC family transcriptional regulator [Nocardia arthritidis]QIS09695.1 helix-turn-helix domain-containing protein [Nocardia arthritidis]